jgi:hypothetical protein
LRKGANQLAAKAGRQDGKMILHWTAPGVLEAEHSSARSPAIVRRPNWSPRCAHMTPQSIGERAVENGNGAG